MVDSSYFKNNGNKGSNGKNNGKLIDRLKKHKWIPMVVLIIIALVLIALQYFMLDVLEYARQMAEQQNEGFIGFPHIVMNLIMSR